jgi:hypothetical protein
VEEFGEEVWKRGQKPVDRVCIVVRASERQAVLAGRAPEEPLARGCGKAVECSGQGVDDLS